jgi:hypothetical protein
LLLHLTSALLPYQSPIAKNVHQAFSVHSTIALSQLHNHCRKIFYLATTNSKARGIGLSLEQTAEILWPRYASGTGTGTGTGRLVLRIQSLLNGC